MVDIIDKGITKKIRALLAKVRGTENEHEAAMFASKAATMLQEHNLREMDLGGEDATEPMIQRNMHSVDWNPWRIHIVGSLCELYFSQFYVTNEIYKGKLRRCIVIVGRPHNLDIVESMHEYLVKTTQRLAKEFSSYRKDVLDFEKGCGARLAQRVMQMAVAAKAPAPQVTYEPGVANLPALYKTEIELAKGIVDSVCGGNLARSSGHRGGGHGAAAGRRAADGVSLGGQLGQKAGSRLLGNG